MSDLPARMVNAFVPGRAALSPRAEAMVERRARLLGPAYRLFYDNPLEVVRGEGVFLYDERGEAYLDCYNNVASLGHAHPAVVEAMTRQASVVSTNTRYLGAAILDYAERLLATFPAEIGHVMFTCTGSEANDLALRIAKAATGGTGVIVTTNAYHGVTEAVAAFSPSLGPGVDLGAHVRTIPPPDDYRLSTDAGGAFAAAVAAAAADLKRHGIQPAALIVDTIFSSDGVFVDSPGCLRAAAEAIRAAGGLFIADEVQPGFGRTGRMWGFEAHGVVPDLVTLGKPMGNGYPVAGVAMRPEIIAAFGSKARYFNTFGGNSVAVATAAAVLDVIRRDRLADNAAAMGRSIRQGLDALAARYPAIGHVRSAGLFFGVEIVADRAAKTPDAATTARIVNGLRDRRVLISATGPHANILKIRPPLVLEQAHADLLIGALTEVLDAVTA